MRRGGGSWNSCGGGLTWDCFEDGRRARCIVSRSCGRLSIRYPDSDSDALAWSVFKGTRDEHLFRYILMLLL